MATIIDVPSDSRLWYDDRDIPFLQEDEKDDADIQQVQAATIRTLVDAGFTWQSAVSAVTNGDMTMLEHTGLFSVQLQKPGSEDPANRPGRARTATGSRRCPHLPSRRHSRERAKLPPAAGRIRAMPDLEFRAAGDLNEDLGHGYLGLVKIRFSPVNEWTEINSAWEGRFMERFAPGAWRKTIAERASKIRALFQHGRTRRSATSRSARSPARGGRGRRVRRGQTPGHLLQP
jgi:hypothetical protein